MKISPQTIEALSKEAQKNQLENKKFFRVLANKEISRLDKAFHTLHEQIFAETDCLECGNCCRTLGPRLTNADIRRMAQALRIRPSVLVDKYLLLDEDDDYVFRDMPCPFIDDENYCSIYADRPRACKEYPHTDRRRMRQMLDITLKNIPVCPVVFEIVEELKGMEKI